MSGSKTRSSSDVRRRVLDAGTRMRRQKRQLEALEKDNHHDDPHASFAHLLNKVKLPSFSDGTESKLYYYDADIIIVCSVVLVN